MVAELTSDSLKNESERLMSENCDATLEDDKHPFCSRNGRKIIITSKQHQTISKKEDKTFERNHSDDLNKKKWTCSPLIPMRITIFLWFGAGRVPGLFLFVFMMQKGLSLVEFSTVFSVTFLFQFLCATVSGIIADKIGNSKPVLMFLMLCTMTTVICMILAPTVNYESCVRDIRCAGDFKETSMNNFKVNLICFEKDTKHFQLRKTDFNAENNYSTESTVVVPFCNVSNQHEISNANNCFSIHLRDMLQNETDFNCSELCLSYLNNTETTCSESENKYAVIIYSILIILFFSFWSTTFRFCDITVMGLVNKYDTYYGKERFVQLLGELTAAILITFVLSKSPSHKNFYDTVYCVSAAGIFLAFISAFFIRGQINPPGQNMTKKALKLIQNTDVMMFFLLVFVLGNSFCFNQNFNLWFLEKLNAPKVLLGVHGIMYSIYGIPLLLTSEWWLKRFGPRKIFVLSLLCYSFNQISYSFIYNPWISLSVEWTTAFTYHLLWVSVVKHSYEIAPQGLFATINALCGVLHFAIGRSSGNFGGGLLMNALGPRTTYRIFATICIVTAILYSAFIYRSRLFAVKASEFKSAEAEEIKV